LAGRDGWDRAPVRPFGLGVATVTGGGKGTEVGSTVAGGTEPWPAEGGGAAAALALGVPGVAVFDAGDEKSPPGLSQAMRTPMSTEVITVAIAASSLERDADSPSRS
jgi:hypothetical protein